MVSLRALAWEAARRRVTYGELTAHLTAGEEEEIEARFRAHLRAQRRQAGRKGAERRQREKKKEEK